MNMSQTKATDLLEGVLIVADHRGDYSLWSMMETLVAGRSDAGDQDPILAQC
jgi:hypothetical protein